MQTSCSCLRRVIREGVEEVLHTLVKSVSTSFGQQFKLSEQSPKTEAKYIEMTSVPYASGVGSFMYALVCSRSDSTYAMSMVS